MATHMGALNRLPDSRLRGGALDEGQRWGWGKAAIALCALQSATQAASGETASYFSSSLYNRAQEALEPAAPPFLFSGSAGLNEILTDNGAETDSNREFDASSLFSLGATVTADTPRLSGIVSGTATYRVSAEGTTQNQLFGDAFAQGRGILIPSRLLISFNGLVDDIVREGGGIQNSTIQSAENTHVYIIGASPVLLFPVEKLGTNVTRYQFGEVWFANNTLRLGNLDLGPIDGERDQSLREDFRMAGTIAPRLLSDVSLAARENNSGNFFSGVLTRYSGELINEYELTRAVSVIFAGGYEVVRDDSLISPIDTQGITWDFGGRMRPNVDSYFLLVYGRHDGKADFAGEVEWRITPFTDIYADYSDSLGTAQQNLMSNSASSHIGSDGAVSGITFDQSPLIGVLDDELLSGGPASDLSALGIPIGTANNVSPLQNGLFRTRQIRGSARYTKGFNHVVFSAFDVRNDSLTSSIPSSAIKGESITWSRDLEPGLSANVQASYSRVTGFEDANLYQFAAGASYALSGSMNIALRYDFIWHKTVPSGSGYLQNAITLSLHKSFD